MGEAIELEKLVRPGTSRISLFFVFILSSLSSVIRLTKFMSRALTQEVRPHQLNLFLDAYDVEVSNFLILLLGFLFGPTS